MRTFARIAAVLALVLTGAGCIYQHTVAPLTLNHKTTPVTGTSRENDIKCISYPLSNFGVMWGDAALGDIAREKGLQELYFADLETLSVLTIWRQYTVHLYGK
jgi:hypothetical protein